MTAPARFGHAGGPAWSAERGWHDAAPCQPGETLRPAGPSYWVARCSGRRRWQFVAGYDGRPAAERAAADARATVRRRVVVVALAAGVTPADPDAAGALMAAVIEYRIPGRV